MLESSSISRMCVATSGAPAGLGVGLPCSIMPGRPRRASRLRPPLHNSYLRGDTVPLDDP